MHAAAFAFVARTLFDQPWREAIARTFGILDPKLPPRRAVVELGSLDINGSVRQLFMGSHYVGVDVQRGPGVDVVADAAIYEPPFTPDTVVCCEVLEHTPDGARILANAHRMLCPGGMLIVTCATEPRAPHSAVDGVHINRRKGRPAHEWYRKGARRPEHYQNVSEDELLAWLEPFDPVITDTDNPGDLYAVAFKPLEPLEDADAE